MADILQTGLGVAGTEAGSTAVASGITAATGVPVPKEAVQAAANVANTLTDKKEKTPSPSPNTSSSPENSNNSTQDSGMKNYISDNMNILHTYAEKMIRSTGADKLLTGAPQFIADNVKKLYNFMTKAADSATPNSVSPEVINPLQEAASKQQNSTNEPAPESKNTPGLSN